MVVVRILGYGFLLFGVYGETGFWTTAGLALVGLEIELRNWKNRGGDDR